ncbi:MAG: AMP-binding protein [Treponema sp.]|nr:AMP-binding protein [Treponema sp.]
MDTQSDRSKSVLKGRSILRQDGLTAIDLFRRQARIFPEKTALVCNDFSISYRDFDRTTDILAAELVRRGLSSMAGIMADHNELAPILIMGVLKAGAAYVPLNPLYPPQRLRHIIEDAGIALVLADADAGVDLHEFSKMVGADIINARELLRSLTGEVRTWGETDISSLQLPTPVPDDLMAVLYTSGSTGNPKGVMIKHKNCISYAQYCEDQAMLSPDNAIASYGSISFAVHITDFFCTFASGAALHIIDHNICFDTKALNIYFESRHITNIIFPVAFGQQFVAQQKNHSLRFMIMTGERFIPLPESPLPYVVYNQYGCTECCTGIALGEIKPGETRITVGTLVNNVNLYILDSRGEIVNLGEKGEICVSGPMLSAGYLNMPEKTAEVFIKNPFNSEAGYERLYHTGDIGMITEDGKLEVLGRVDFQIKIRGFRIEPNEVDACIRHFAGVRESVTVARESKSGIRRLVSYVAADGKIDPLSLRDFVSRSLPPQMVPRFIVQIDKLPRNTNGKLDRAALPPPSFAGDAIIPLKTETEKKLAELWTLVLDLDGQDGISRAADFFELGGDSLRAMALSFEIARTMKTDVSAALIFKTPVLKDMAVAVSGPGSFNPIYVYSSVPDAAPLFFIHGGNIGPEAYAPLAEKLPPDMAFYCFENYNIYNPGSGGIVSLAGRYIEFLKARIPRGPYTLGGWSFGGYVAFEMALQLQSRGETVKCLYLLDPGLVLDDEEKRLRKKLLNSNNYRDYLEKDPLFERFRSMGLLDILLVNNKKVSMDICDYVPTSVYHGKVILFKAMKPDPVNPALPSEILDALKQLRTITEQKKANGFDKYAPNLRIIEIPEIHDGFMRGAALDTIASVICQQTNR